MKGKPPARMVKVKPRLYLPENLSVERGADATTSQLPYVARCSAQGDGYPLVVTVNQHIEPVSKPHRCLEKVYDFSRRAIV